MQAYAARLPEKRRASDAEYLDDDVYASVGGQPVETAPNGLVDRLYQEEFDDEPIRGRPGQAVPTTKNRYA